MRTWSRAWALAYVLCFASVNSVPAVAEELATVSGRVADPNGLPVPEVKVQAVNVSTNIAYRTETNDVGLFSIPSLPPGTYRVIVEKEGFVQIVKPGVELHVADNIALNFSLRVGSLTQSVTVESGSPLLDTESATMGAVVDNRKILDLPLNGRQFLQLALLVPGVNAGAPGSPQNGQGIFYFRPTVDSSVSIDGGRSNGSNFMLDGTTNIDPNFQTIVLNPTVDSLYEFKVQTNNFSAAYGRSASGQIDIISKSGSNALHGSLFEFLRNNALDGRPFNLPATLSLPAFRQNQFGGTAGGPIRKDKTFFFGSYEGFRRTEGQTTISTVPTMLEHQGDFSQVVAIYDPFTGGGGPRSRFPNDTIPSARFNSITKAVIDQWVPTPNISGQSVNNFINTEAITQANDEFSARVDQHITGADNVFARYSFSDERGFFPGALPKFGILSRVRAQNLSLGMTHIFSSQTVNDFRFGFIRLRNARTQENAFKVDFVGQHMIPGLGFGGPINFGVPGFNVPGFVSFGDAAFATPSLQRDNAFQWIDRVSTVRGKHTLEFGAEVVRTQFNLLAFFQSRGRFDFTPGITSQTGMPGDTTGNALASFLLGLPASEEAQVGETFFNLRSTSFAGYFQDQFRVSPRLTLSLGLRYELQTPFTDIHNHISSYNASPATIAANNGMPLAFIAGQGGPRGLYETDKNNWAPRFGFAYQPPWVSRLVVRGGYGIFYGQNDGNTYFNDVRNLPFVFAENVAGSAFQPLITQLGFASQLVLGGPGRVSMGAFDVNRRTPYTQEWNLTLEKQLGNSFVVEAGYVGSASHKLERERVTNDPLPGLGDIDARRPFQNFAFPLGTKFPATIQGQPLMVASNVFPIGFAHTLEDSANANYHSLQVRAQRRYSYGLSFLGSYTFSKSIDDAPPFRKGSGAASTPQNSNNLAAERALSDFDARHRLVASLTYDLPFGQNKAFGNSAGPAVNTLISGWQLSGITTFQSGFPFTVEFDGDFLNTGSSGARPDAVPGVNPVLPSGQRSPAHYLNLAAFAIPTTIRYGTLGRNTVIGPGIKVVDLGILKTTPLRGDRARVQFRAELFNFANHPNLSQPHRFIDDSDFGTITSQSTTPREIQFALKIIF